jgi:5,10-methylenetetrahydromethanopterin reductase
MELAVAATGDMPVPEIIGLARDCDARGLSELWITEDYFEHGAFALAGAILGATQKLTVGIGVVNPWTRHPMLTAMETATLASLAPGRVKLALGASNRRWIQYGMGITYERPMATLQSGLLLLRRALSGDRCETVWQGEPMTAQLATPPAVPVDLAVGVKGRRGLELLAPDTDAFILSLLSSPEYVRWVRNVVGRRHRLHVLVAACVDDDVARARDTLRPFVARFLGIHGAHDITRVAGVDPATAATHRAAWLSGSIRVDLVSDEEVERFCLVGDPEAVSRRLDHFAADGADTVIVQHHGSHENLLRLLGARPAG